MTDSSDREIVRLVTEAEILDEGEVDIDSGGYGDPPEPPFGDGEPDGLPPDDPVDPSVVEDCAALDHSDTDNGKRLIAHFGADLSILAQDEVASGAQLAWTGTHWTLADGAQMWWLIAQRLGARIALEGPYLKPTPQEKRDLEAAAGLEDRPRGELSDDEKARLMKAERAQEAMDKRRARRWNHAVTSKNKAKMQAAIDCAASHLRRPPDRFNVDRYRVATSTHTLAFSRSLNEEHPDPDVTVFVGEVDAMPGHRRDDWITSMVPVAWKAGAPAPRWRAFLERMLPNADKRRTVQQFTGLGLLALPVQFLMFHYGLGANGKSVFLETVSRVLGPGLSVGLPRESIVGGSERNAGAASPDLVRLYGKRFVRILEVAGNLPLQEDLVKRLTGGEPISVRTLFKGYFEFQCVACAHMSGNDKPQVLGTDHGIWRRILLVHWDQTIPEGERGDFEEVVSRFVREEAEGILAWLVEGVLDFLSGGGLFVADAVRADTAEYRDEMDPVGEFFASCARAGPGLRVQASTMYDSYISWSLANAKKPLSQTRFGKRAAQLYEKKEYSGRLFYEDCELHDVPERPAAPQPH